MRVFKFIINKISDFFCTARNNRRANSLSVPCGLPNSAANSAKVFKDKVSEWALVAAMWRLNDDSLRMY